MLAQTYLTCPARFQLGVKNRIPPIGIAVSAARIVTTGGCLRTVIHTTIPYPRRSFVMSRCDETGENLENKLETPGCPRMKYPGSKRVGRLESSI